MNPCINTRRSAFENYSRDARSLTLAGTTPNSGVSELQEIAKENSAVKRSMDIYGWHQGHKVFATDDMSGLKLVANAGSMTYRGQHWRTCVVRNAEVAQVMSFPFAITAEDYLTSLYVPGYDEWLYGRLMFPEQSGSHYRLGDKNTGIADPPVYRVSQYLTILNDLVTELLTACPDVEQIATTYYQVRDSLTNLINSPDYLSRSLPAGETLTHVAEKLATLLRDRDGNPSVAREYVNYVNRLPPQAFFQAMQLIATDQVTLRDSENQAVPSSSLFHHSVFYDGDLIRASRHLTGSLTGNEADSFTLYGVKRSLQEALRHIPTTSLDHITSLDEAIETIHRQAGKKVESKLRHVYLQKLVQDEILSQPRLSLESIKEMLPNLLALAKETKGITSLMIAILPGMAEIPNLNQSLAELLLRTAGAPDKNKLIIPIESLRQPLPPEQLTLLVQKNIDRLNAHQTSINAAPPTVARFNTGYVLQHFIDQFRSTVVPQWLDKGTELSGKCTGDGMSTQIAATPQKLGSLMRDSSGNHLLIKGLFDHIAKLTIHGRFSELTSLVEELRTREPKTKRRLIGARTACRLIGRILQHKIALNQIDQETVESLFKQLHSVLPTIDSYLSVSALEKQPIGRGSISQIIQALFKPRASIEHHRCADLEPVEFFTLPECIARQQTRNQQLQQARDNRLYECCICLESQAIPKLLNHNTSLQGQPEKNGHPGMPVCKPCVGRLVRLLPPRCPACRAAITERDYVPFLPDYAQTP